MDNINDILRAKRIVRQNGYTIKKPARDYDYEREDRMNLIRAKRIVKDAGYSYIKPEEQDFEDDYQEQPVRRPNTRPASRYTEEDDDDVEVPVRRPRTARQQDLVDDEYRRTIRRVPKPNDFDDDEYDDIPEPSFPGRKRFQRQPAPQQDVDDFETPRRRPAEPVSIGLKRKTATPAPATPAAPAAPEAPEAPAQEEQPVRKTRQEIYQDIAAKYV